MFPGPPTGASGGSGYPDSLKARLGAAVACVNLWYILVLHASFAVAVAITWRIAKNREYKLDANAVRLTNDLRGAIAFIKRSSHHSHPTAEERIKRLNAVFGS